MSQALVTDFFSTRKRNRFQEDGPAKTKGTLKTKAVETVLPDTAVSPTKRCLRSSSRLAGKATSESTKSVVEIAKNEARPKPKSERKEKIEALKARMKRLDDDMARSQPQPQSQPQPIETTQPEVSKKEKIEALKAKMKRLSDEINRTQKPEPEVEQVRI